MPAKAMVFVDVPNFEKSLKARYAGYFLEYPSFFAKLTAQYELVAIHWFDTMMAEEVNAMSYWRQQNFWHALQQRNPTLVVHRLPLRRAHIPGKRWQETGLDQLFSSLLALEAGRYDVAFLLTCDGDQDAVVRTLQREPWRKYFIMAALESQPGYKLRQACDEVLELTAAWLEETWRRRPAQERAAATDQGADQQGEPAPGLDLPRRRDKPPSER